jgi:hypothetical protein
MDAFRNSIGYQLQPSVLHNQFSAATQPNFCVFSCLFAAIVLARPSTLVTRPSRIGHKKAQNSQKMSRETSGQCRDLPARHHSPVKGKAYFIRLRSAIGCRPRSPLPAPRSPLPAPRSPLPAPRSTLHAPCFPFSRFFVPLCGYKSDWPQKSSKFTKKSRETGAAPISSGFLLVTSYSLPATIFSRLFVPLRG